jgi:metacaspase-1
LPPPVDIVSRFEGEEDEMKPAKGFTPINRGIVHHILWSGCLDYQTSADAFITGSYNGAFTYFFCNHMRETQGRISRKNLLKRIRQSLRHYGYSQVPDLEAEATKQKVMALTLDGKV